MGRYSTKSTASDRNNAPKTRDAVQERESVATVSSSNRVSPPTASQQGRKDAKKQAVRKQIEAHTAPETNHPIQHSALQDVPQSIPKTQDETSMPPRAKARRERFSEKPTEKGIPTGTQPHSALAGTEQTPFKERQETVKSKSAQTRTVPAARVDNKRTNTNSTRSIQPVKQRRTAAKEAEKPLRTAEASQRTVQAAKPSQAAQAAAKVGKQAAESGKI